MQFKIYFQRILNPWKISMSINLKPFLVQASSKVIILTGTDPLSWLGHWLTRIIGVINRRTFGSFGKNFNFSIRANFLFVIINSSVIIRWNFYFFSVIVDFVTRRTVRLKITVWIGPSCQKGMKFSLIESLHFCGILHFPKTD